MVSVASLLCLMTVQVKAYVVKILISFSFTLISKSFLFIINYLNSLYLAAAPNSILNKPSCARSDRAANAAKARLSDVAQESVSSKRSKLRHARSSVALGTSALPFSPPYSFTGICDFTLVLGICFNVLFFERSKLNHAAPVTPAHSSVALGTSALLLSPPYSFTGIRASSLFFNNRICFC